MFKQAQVIKGDNSESELVWERIGMERLHFSANSMRERPSQKLFTS